MQCGDVYVRQTSGTAMGKPCALPWAILFEGLREINQILPLFTEQLPLYLRFVDDVKGVWDPHEDPVEDEVIWQAYAAEMINYLP